MFLIACVSRPDDVDNTIAVCGRVQSISVLQSGEDEAVVIIEVLGGQRCTVRTTKEQALQLWANLTLFWSKGVSCVTIADNRLEPIDIEDAFDFVAETVRQYYGVDLDPDPWLLFDDVPDDD